MSSEVSPAMQPVTEAATIAAAVSLLMPQIEAQLPSTSSPFVEGTTGQNPLVLSFSTPRVVVPPGVTTGVDLPNPANGGVCDITIAVLPGYPNAVPIIPSSGTTCPLTTIQPGETVTLSWYSTTSAWIVC